MKRLFFSLCLSMFLGGTAFSQISLLMEGGANYGKSSISKNEIRNHDNILSYYLAATPKFGITKKIKVITEVQYSVEGAETNIKGLHQGEEISFRQHFFRLIPGVQLDILGPFSLVGGLNIGYATSESLKDVDGNKVLSDFVSLYKKNDIGALIGLNLNVNGINIIAKYNYGFRNLNDTYWTDRDGNAVSDIAIKSRFLQVGVGYEFGL